MPFEEQEKLASLCIRSRADVNTLSALPAQGFLSKVPVVLSRLSLCVCDVTCCLASLSSSLTDIAKERLGSKTCIQTLSSTDP